MTTIAEAHTIVRERFRDQIQTPRGLSVFYDNWPPTLPPANAPVVMLRVTTVDSTVVEGGDGVTKRQSGYMRAEIKQPVATPTEDGVRQRGSALAWELASAIESAFAAHSHGGVRWWDASFEDYGVVSPWFILHVTIPFESERDQQL